MEKEVFEKAARSCRLIAVIDSILAFICAVHGNYLFIFFMLLAGGMLVYGAWAQSKADELQGE